MKERRMNDQKERWKEERRVMERKMKTKKDGEKGWTDK